MFELRQRTSINFIWPSANREGYKQQQGTEPETRKPGHFARVLWYALGQN